MNVEADNSAKPAEDRTSKLPGPFALTKTAVVPVRIEPGAVADDTVEALHAARAVSTQLAGCHTYLMPEGFSRLWTAPRSEADRRSQHRVVPLGNGALRP